MDILSRADWGFDGWLNGVAPAAVPMSERTEFMIHYDGGTAVGSSTGPAMVRGIHAFHKNGRGWAGIGYSFVIDQAGVIYEGRGWDLQGAHCPNHNRSAFGVQIHIGGSEQPSPAALASAVALYAEACRRTGRPLARLGHRDGFSTDCPGEVLYAWVRAGMPAPGGVAGARQTTPTTPNPTQEDDMTYVFMRTTEPGNPTYMLAPGQPVRHLSDQELNLWTRAGAVPRGGDFLRAEVDIINNTIQPLPVSGPDPATIAAQLAATLPADLAQQVAAELAKRLEN